MAEQIERWTLKALALSQAVNGNRGIGDEVDGALADEVGVGLDGALRPRIFDRCERMAVFSRGY
jgi:hypothetical protein